MSREFNTRLFLWAVSVCQPVTITEALGFLKTLYPGFEDWPSREDLKTIEDNLLKKRYIYPAHKKLAMYCITQRANDEMPLKLRRSRDKARLTLLRGCHDATLKGSGVVAQELDGVAPSADTRCNSQEAESRPKILDRASCLTKRFTVQNLWPRVVEQLNLEVGLNSYTPDTSSTSFKYYSYPSLSSLQKSTQDQSLNADMTITQLAHCIGISPRLLTSFTHKPENHYRNFELAKKGTGTRTISSPRFFLKTVQYWISTYFLAYLPVHESSQAFEKGRSIITNAEKHVGQDFVANIDIEDFFGNISQKNVEELFLKNGFGENLAYSLSKLLTFDGSIPQGAPSSPKISNAFLYDFDLVLAEKCKSNNLKYSRYADDITISGKSRSEIVKLIKVANRELKKNALKLNDSKTRIASKSACQKVTGVVVNELLQPPKKYRKRVRAMFNNAMNEPSSYLNKISELRGHLSYLKSFPKYQNSNSTIESYREVIDMLKHFRE